MKQERKPGTVPEGKLGVYNRAGEYCGHVGSHSSSAVASRISGERGHVLGKKNGKQSWVMPPGPTPAQVSAAAAKAAANHMPTGTNPLAPKPPTPSLLQSLRAAKGSTNG